MNHELYMNRCLELAKNGLGTTYPNPMVGSVIVYDDKIIGEGWHKKAGEPHAEVNAVNSVKDKSLLQKSTIYVSLEPCSHFGKTPPCCDLILADGIPNIVVGTVDPNEKVAGSGIAKLKAAGRNVTLIENDPSFTELAKQCREINKRFFTFHNKKRPYVILKWAKSADGFIAPLSKSEQKPVWISNTYSRQLVHKWRAEEQSILVGTQTVVDDNPMLDVRDWTGKNPVRIVIDKSGRISKESHIFDNQVKTIVFCASETVSKNDQIQFEKIDFGSDIPTQIMAALYCYELQSVIVEGGAKTLQSFIDAGLWDEARVFTGETVFVKGVKAPEFKADVQHKYSIGNDELLIFRKHD